MSQLVGVIGSRSLPEDFSPVVHSVVAFFLSLGFDIASGGAMGADFYALSALLDYSASSSGTIFSAWQSISGFPAAVRPRLLEFRSHGGRILWGPASTGAPRHEAVAALLGRNTRLISACSLLIAFLRGDSRGSLRTVREALAHDIPVIIFICGSDTPTPPDIATRCLVFSG